MAELGCILSGCGNHNTQMKSLLSVLGVTVVLAVGAVAQTPPATQPAPQAKPQAKPQPRASSAGVTLSVQVTDRSGNPIGDVSVRAGGPVDRSGSTGQDGTIGFRAMRAGTYRLRFERDGFTTLEREVVLRNQSADVSVSLTAAPVKPAPPAPVQPPPPVAPVRTPRAIEPRSLSIPDYLDKNLIGSDPVKTSLLACMEGGTAVLLQVRDPLSDRQHADADEVLYVVAGAGILRIRNQDTKMQPGHFALVPRGVPHSLRRDGRNPMIAVSVLAGEPCTETTPPVR
jgi:mannose-6-phosphate isomerase-like protein (cupin superfamily)